MRDKLWFKIKSEASEVLRQEPSLSLVINRIILSHTCLEQSIIYQLSQKISSNDMGAEVIAKICQEAFKADDSLIKSAELDLLAVFDRDPACNSIMQPIIFFKGDQYKPLSLLLLDNKK